MTELTTAQRYQFILADIAMAAAIATLDVAVEPHDLGGAAPGALRDRWLARHPDGALRRRVTAMANAGVGSLQQLSPERLEETAKRFGAPIDAETAAAIAEHFAARREAWLEYNR